MNFPPVNQPISGLIPEVWARWFNDVKRLLDGTGLNTKIQTKLTTSDATQTTIQTLPLEDNTVYDVSAIITGRNSSDRASYNIEGTVYREGGNAVIEGQTVVHSAESDSAWDATYTVSGNDLRVSVTGTAGTDINWSCFFQWVKS